MRNMKRISLVVLLMAIVAIAVAFNSKTSENNVTSEEVLVSTASADQPTVADELVELKEMVASLQKQVANIVTPVPTTEPTSTPAPVVAVSDEQDEPEARPTTDEQAAHSMVADPALVSFSEFWHLCQSEERVINAKEKVINAAWVDDNRKFDVHGIEFTDVDIMTHIGKSLDVMVASRSLSVKVDGRNLSGKEVAKVEPRLMLCEKHKALKNFHSRAIGEMKVLNLTEEEMKAFEAIASYWYDAEGNLVYGIRICNCENGKSYASHSSNGGSSHEEPKPTAKPTTQPSKDQDDPSKRPTTDEQPAHSTVATVSVSTDQDVPEKRPTTEEKPAHTTTVSWNDFIRQDTTSGSNDNASASNGGSSNGAPSHSSDEFVPEAEFDW